MPWASPLGIPTGFGDEVECRRIATPIVQGMAMPRCSRWHQFYYSLVSAPGYMSAEQQNMRSAQGWDSPRDVSALVPAIPLVFSTLQCISRRFSRRHFDAPQAGPRHRTQAQTPDAENPASTSSHVRMPSASGALMPSSRISPMEGPR